MLIKDLRRAAGYTQKQLAEKALCSAVRVGQWEANGWTVDDSRIGLAIRERLGKLARKVEKGGGQ